MQNFNLEIQIRMNSYNNTVIVIFKLKYWRKCIDVLCQVFKAKMTKKLNKISTLFCNNFIFQKYKVLKYNFIKI